MSFAPLKLSELAEEIRRTLEDSFAGQVYWVMADVTNHSFYSLKKHHYFDLVGERKKRHHQQDTGRGMGRWRPPHPGL